MRKHRFQASKHGNLCSCHSFEKLEFPSQWPRAPQRKVHLQNLECRVYLQLLRGLTQKRNQNNNHQITGGTGASSDSQRGTSNRHPRTGEATRIISHSRKKSANIRIAASIPHQITTEASTRLNTPRIRHQICQTIVEN